MPMREIPPREWAGFFDRFSRLHQGWHATVETIGSTIGAALEARDQPLLGITAAMKDQRCSIAIMVGGTTPGHLTHIVCDPKYVRLNKTNDGDDEALAIESVDGVTTLLHFRSAAGVEARKRRAV